MSSFALRPMSVEELGLAHASVSASVTQSTTSGASGVVALSEHNTKRHRSQYQV